MRLARAWLAAMVLVGPGSVMAAVRMEPPPGRWTLSTDGERITIWANEAPLRDLMEEISAVTPAKVDIDNLPDRTVSVRYTNLPLEDLLAKLNVSFVLTFARESSGEYALESAWVSHFAPSPGGGPAPAGGAPVPGAPGAASFASGALPLLLGYTDTNQVLADTGNLYRSPYPLSMNVDGKIDEWPPELPWQVVTHQMGQGVATNDADASFRFASSADAENLYLAFKVRDDGKVLLKDEIRDAPQEDSLEITVNDHIVVMQRHHVWRTNAEGEPTGSGRQYVTLYDGSRAIVVDQDDGYVVEMAIPLSSVGVNLEQGQEVNFNIVMNDDDDGGDRDNTLIWSTSRRMGGPTPSLLRFVKMPGQ